MSGIIGLSPDMKSGVVGKFPAGHVVHVEVVELAGTNDESTSTAWANTGLEITVPAAKAALGSKIFVTYSHVFGVNQGTQNRRIDYVVHRTTPSPDYSLLAHLYVGLSANDDDGNEHIRINSSSSATDDSLGTGDHTYKLQFRKAAGTASQAGAIYYKGHLGMTLTMTAMVIV